MCGSNARRSKVHTEADCLQVFGLLARIESTFTLLRTTDAIKTGAARSNLHDMGED